MTVSYTPSIGTASKFGAFGKVIFIWQGSLYKLTLPGLFLYLIAYFILSFIYRFLLSPFQKEQFEAACMFCEQHSNLIPLTFVLAFYVSVVVSRWWDQWNALSWPDNVAFKVNMYCRGIDENSRLIRRTVIRYINLSITMTYRYISSKVYKRFPTLDHLVDAGLLTEKEMVNLKAVNSRSEFLRYVHWIPLSWASSLVVNAYEQGYIKDEGFVREIENEILAIKSNLGTTLGYDWINLPVVYTQCVTLAVYSYFGFALLGRQWLDTQREIPGYTVKVDYYFPIFTCLQYLFYVGWLKVAEALMNPYGEDDDDFDMNWMIDRHLQVSFMMIDEVGQFPPQPVRDNAWDIGIPTELPYTVASLPFRGSVPASTAFGLEVSLADQQTIHPHELMEAPDKPPQISKVADGVRDIYEQVAQFFNIAGSNTNLSEIPSGPASNQPRRSFSILSQRKRSRQHSIAVMNEAYRTRTLSENSDGSEKPPTSPVRKISNTRNVNFAFDNFAAVQNIEEGPEDDYEHVNFGSNAGAPSGAVPSKSEQSLKSLTSVTEEDEKETLPDNTQDKSETAGDKKEAVQRRTTYTAYI